MDGQDADAFNLSRWDGLVAKLFFPIGDEGSQLRRVFLQVIAHSIEEGEQIGILLFDAGKLEDAHQLFKQFVEWHQAEIVRFIDKRLWQELVYITQQEGVKVKLILQYFVLIRSSQLCLGYSVFGIDKVAKCIHQHADDQRCIQSESFVGNDPIGGVLVEIVGNQRYLAILADKDGHVVDADASLNHGFHFVGHLLQGIFLIADVFLVAQ